MTAVVGYRVADWDTPLWSNPNRSPSRFSIPGEAVQYWSLHPLTPWAEYLRGMNLRDPDQAAEIRLRPWAAEIALPDHTVDLTFEATGDLGLDQEALVDDDWTICQEWVLDNRPPAMLVPSAALPGTVNIVLFGPRVRSRYGVVPIDLGLDVPCDPAAHDASVVVDLLQHIRWRGEPHAGLLAWQTGDDPPLPPLVETPPLPI